jgi:hypothetical protein
VADYDITEQDVFDGIPEDTKEGCEAWKDQALLWPAIGRLAQRKLVEEYERFCTEHVPGGQVRFSCVFCMAKLRKEVGLDG